MPGPLVRGGSPGSARPASPSEMVYGAQGGAEEAVDEAAQGGAPPAPGAAPPAPGAAPAAPGAAPAAAGPGGGGLVVEDSAEAAPHQMKKMALVNEVKSRADAAGKTPPPAMFDEWSHLSAQELESKIHDQVPGSKQAKSAKDLVAPIVERVASGGEGMGPVSGGELGSPEAVRAALGGGEPLGGSTRASMERAFDHNFGAVRIHANDKGAALAGEYGARAVAFGNDIAFGGNEYQPGSPVGDALIAHELAHVVQQQGQFAGPLRKSIGGESSALDSDADQAAMAAVQNIHGGASGKAAPMLRSGVGIQRCPPGTTATPPAVTIGTTDIAGHAAAWSPFGQFSWWINWTTTGRSGWIVQKITNTYAGTDGTGTAITNASVGATPSYYEAWEVDAGGGITGSLGGTGNRDKWDRPSLGAGSKGNWSMQGDVYWTAVDPAKSGMASGTIGNAGSLLSSVGAPASLSGRLLSRNANGAWDTTTVPATPHAGAAT